MPKRPKRHGNRGRDSRTRSRAASELPDPRSEGEVLSELKALAANPGFIHALAALVFKSNVVTAVDEFTANDFLKIYRPDRLIRTESNLLIGLMLSAPVYFGIPTQGETFEYMTRAVALLEELHQAIIAQGRDVFFAALEAHGAGDLDANPLNDGVLLREAIFYGGESAFPFQYEALARKRYANDRDWLQENVGFDIDEAADVLVAIRAIVTENFPQHRAELRHQPPEQWTWLPLFRFSLEHVEERTSLPREKIAKVIEAFVIEELDCEQTISRIGDYNKASTRPIVRFSDGSLYSFLEYGALAALYENPFYWIAKDKKYLGTHSQIRGNFAETVTEEAICEVFPNKFVYRNVVFKDESGKDLSEADVVLLYGHRAFIIQAKSKRLTLASWKGEDEALARDFQAAVQQAYDQAIECIRSMKADKAAYINGKRVDLKKDGKIRAYYPICVTSEHYPALSFQSSSRLKLEQEADIEMPIVTDVFSFDVMSEMLETPLFFTDYLAKRAAASGRLQVSHELVALSWYIKNNLHIEDNEFFAVSDDYMVELDLAMSVRRSGIDGQRTPRGQLTRFEGTPVGKLLEYVNSSDRPDVHRLGEVLLSMNGNTADALNKGIKQAIRMTRADQRQHDVTIGLQGGGGGISVHCNEKRPSEARSILNQHCEMRKYTEKADKWYGVTVDVNGAPVIMMGLEFPWKFDALREEEARPFRVRAVTHSLFGARKIGRNDPCPCGSGKKYKKCCLN